MVYGWGENISRGLEIFGKSKKRGQSKYNTKESLLFCSNKKWNLIKYTLHLNLLSLFPPLSANPSVVLLN